MLNPGNPQSIDNTVLQILEEVVPRTAIYTDADMSALTSFKAGGKASVLVEPETDEQIAIAAMRLVEKNVPFFILGNGTNTLVKDTGYKGVVIHVGKKFNKTIVEGDRIIAYAGASLSSVAREAANAGLKGMEFAAGIPGSVGGAVAMNAGAYGGEMKDIIENVTVIGENGEPREIKAKDMAFGYRTSRIQNEKLIVTKVVIKLTRGDKNDIFVRMDELAALRREKQPLELPSAGSTFKRPEGNYAGKLIMEAGLRGYRIGGAEVSEKHCGFIVNTGNATATDIVNLMTYVMKTVFEKSGIMLEPEIVVLG
ncbi:MAG: UDP-N-acetylmuramate dehydrogenase [Lachnospiraceae bacterium]|nr:UDP-N-acetylmuramate dehydrogenase [Lachnospiraceae bacterium]